MQGGVREEENVNDMGNAINPENAGPQTFWVIKDVELVFEIVLSEEKQ